MNRKSNEPAKRDPAGRDRSVALRRLFPALALAFALLGGPTPVAAQPASESAAERFQKLPEERKEELRRRWRELQAMSPERRALLEKRLQRFQAMPPERREAVRRNWQAFQRLSPTERAELERRFEGFSRLSPEERARLREELRSALKNDGRQQLDENANRWRGMSEEQRERMRERLQERRERRRLR